MNDLPTREQASGILLVKDLMISNNSDAVAIIQAYIEGRLIDRATIDRDAVLAAVYRAGKPWTTTDGDMQTSDKTWAELVNAAVDAAVKGTDDE